MERIDSHLIKVGDLRWNLPLEPLGPSFFVYIPCAVAPHGRSPGVLGTRTPLPENCASGRPHAQVLQWSADRRAISWVPWDLSFGPPTTLSQGHHGTPGPLSSGWNSENTCNTILLKISWSLQSSCINYMDQPGSARYVSCFLLGLQESTLLHN